MRGITPFINIKPDKLDYINQNLCSQEEVVYASKLQFNFPPQRDLPTQTGYAVLSYGFIYLLTKVDNELKLVERICLFNCSEIKFVNEKSKNSKPYILITTLPDQNLYTIFDGKKMETFYEYISYVIFILSNGIASQINVPKLYPPFQKTYYPVQYAIYKRSLYYIHYDMKQMKIPRTAIEGADYFNDPNIYHRGQLTIGPSFHPGNFSSYYGKAIGIEYHISSIKFQDFKEDINELIESISRNTINKSKIIFSDYNTAAPVFNFQKVVNSKIESFEFVNSTFCVIENFMNGCYNCNTTVTSINLSSLAIQQTDLINFFDYINKIRCFHNLTSFGLFDMQFGQFPNEVFGEFLSSHPRIESISISSIDTEGSLLFSQILKGLSNIRELHLNHLNFDNVLNLNDEENPIILPPNLVLLDFSHSKFKNLTLKPVFELLTSPYKNREIKTNLFVDMSHLQPKGNTFVNAFKSLDLQKCNPNIFDFNWSGNLTSSDLFNFLLTQKELQFFSLNEITIDKPKLFFQFFGKFLNYSKIIGLEIGCNTFQSEFVNPFLLFVKEIGTFQHFAFQCQPEQNEIGEVVADLIGSLTNLKEVIINMPKLSKNVYLSIANAVAHNKSVVACKLMSYDNDKKDAKKGEFDVVSHSIRSLRVPTTMEQRASYSTSNKKNLYYFDLASAIESQCTKIEDNDEEEDKIE